MERQQVLELKTIPWPFVILAFDIAQAEHASMTDRRSDYENSQFRYFRKEAVSILRCERLYPLARV
jgi:hypothetical protein